MKLFRTRIGKILLVAGSLIALAILWSFGRDLYWRQNPDVAFRAITGRELPAGVRATAYRYEMNDNFLHTTHYWLLAGSPSGLRQVTNGTGFVESNDAAFMMSDFQHSFGPGVVTTQVVAGYEWDLGRDRWYCILAGEKTACYAH